MKIKISSQRQKDFIFIFIDFHRKSMKKQINSLEILAVLGAILTYPHMFRDRDVLFFVDNMTSLKICVNGYDRHPDITHLSNTIHLALAGLSSRVYFEWVPGKANPSDLPSRADIIVNPITSLFVLDTLRIRTVRSHRN